MALAVAVLVGTALSAMRGRSNPDTGAGPSLFGAVVATRFAFARVGWLFRYEAYLVAWGALLLVPLAGAVPRGLAGLAAAATIAAPLGVRAIDAVRTYPLGARLQSDVNDALALDRPGLAGRHGGRARSRRHRVRPACASSTSQGSAPPSSPGSLDGALTSEAVFAAGQRGVDFYAPAAVGARINSSMSLRHLVTPHIERPRSSPRRRAAPRTMTRALRARLPLAAHGRRKSASTQAKTGAVATWMLMLIRRAPQRPPAPRTPPPPTTAAAATTSTLRNQSRSSGPDLLLGVELAIERRHQLAFELARALAAAAPAPEQPAQLSSHLKVLHWNTPSPRDLPASCSARASRPRLELAQRPRRPLLHRVHTEPERQLHDLLVFSARRRTAAPSTSSPPPGAPPAPP